MGRVWVLRVGSVLLMYLGLKEMWLKGVDMKRIKSLHRLIVLLLIWGCTALVSVYLGSDPWKSLVGNYMRGDGFLTLFAFMVLSIFLAYFWQKNWLSDLAWVMVIAVDVQVILQIISCKNIWSTNCSGLMGNTVLLASLIVVTIPFWHNLLHTQSRGFFRGILALSGLLYLWGLTLSGTWMGVFGIGLFLLSYLQAKGLVKIIGILLLCGVVLSIYWGNQRATEYNPESRVRILVRGYKAFLSRPLQGWGLANFDYAFQSVDWPMHYDHDIVADKAHNEFLEYLVTMGLIGFLCYLYSWKRILQMVTGNRKQWDFWVTLIFVYILTSSVNIIPVGVQFVFWWLLGVSFAGVEEGGRRP